MPFHKKSIYKLPKHGHDVGKALYRPALIGACRKQFFNQRKLSEKINEAIGLICIFQAERNEKRFNHSRHPAMRQ